MAAPPENASGHASTGAARSMRSTIYR